MPKPEVTNIKLHNMLNPKQYDLILASGSPRRKQLLEQLDLEVQVRLQEVDETIPDSVPVTEAACYLAEKKSQAYSCEHNNELIITADTVVVKNDTIFNKPSDKIDAKNMLVSLSGSKHLVITGVCMKTLNKTVAFSCSSEVKFKNLTDEEIEYYIGKYQPFDKAGAYGIQEWIGYVGVEEIHGSYFNIMGFPVHEFCKRLQDF